MRRTLSCRLLSSLLPSCLPLVMLAAAVAKLTVQVAAECRPSVTCSRSTSPTLPPRMQMMSVAQMQTTLVVKRSTSDRPPV